MAKLAQLRKQSGRRGSASRNHSSPNMKAASGGWMLLNWSIS